MAIFCYTFSKSWIPAAFCKTSPDTFNSEIVSHCLHFFSHCTSDPAHNHLFRCLSSFCRTGTIEVFLFFSHTGSSSESFYDRHKNFVPGSMHTLMKGCEHCSMCLLVRSEIHGILCVAYESQGEICVIQFCLDRFFVPWLLEPDMELFPLCLTVSTLSLDLRHLLLNS